MIIRIFASFNSPFEISDTWFDYIEPYLAVRNEVTVADILHNCLFIEPALQKKSQQMRVAEILKRMGWIKKDRGVKVWVYPGSGKGSEQVAVKVAGSEIPTSNESQSSPATSATFLEKNIFTLEDNNENSNPETEMRNRAISSEVADENNNSPKTQSQKASPSNATSAPTSPATSQKIKVEDKETYMQQDLQEMSPTSPTFSQKNNSTKRE